MRPDAVCHGEASESEHSSGSLASLAPVPVFNSVSCAEVALVWAVGLIVLVSTFRTRTPVSTQRLPPPGSYYSELFLVCCNQIKYVRAGSATGSAQSLSLQCDELLLHTTDS